MKPSGLKPLELRPNGSKLLLSPSIQKIPVVMFVGFLNLSKTKSGRVPNSSRKSE